MSRSLGGRATSTVIGIVAVAAACVGCGIAPDAAPRNIAPSEQPIDLRPTRQPVVDDDPSPTGPLVYFLVQRDVEVLEPVRRDVDGDPEALLAALMEGPTEQELAGSINTAIPTGTRVRSAFLNRFPGTLEVDLSSEFLNQQAPAVAKAVAQIVFTATEAQGVQRVVLTVEGDDYPWPSDDGTFLERTAMSRFDFVALDPAEYRDPTSTTATTAAPDVPPG